MHRRTWDEGKEIFKRRLGGMKAIQDKVQNVIEKVNKRIRDTLEEVEEERGRERREKKG